MSISPPVTLVDRLSSRWTRAVIRVLSIRGITWLALALALSATLIACLQGWRWQRARQRTMFQADAKVLRNALVERLGLYAQVLQGSRGLFAANGEVNAAEFQAYAASLNLGENYPGIVGLGYIEMVKDGQRDRFLQRMSADRPLSRDPPQIWPTGERSDYMVVRFVEPLATNRVALGYDIGSEPVRRFGAIESADSGRPTLTSRIEFVQGPGKSGALLFQPVYSQTTGAVSPEDRKARLSGWVYAAFFIEKMMAGVRELGNEELEYKIFDGTEPSAENLLCSSKGAGRPLADSQLEETLSLTVFQRDWLFSIHSSADRNHGPALATVGLFGAGGICISLLIFGVLHSMATSGRRAVALAGEMNSELRRRQAALETSEERLAMMIEGSNDGVWDWELKTDRVYFSPRWKNMLGYRDDEIQNTFDAWKSLLHPEDRDRARRVLSAYFDGRTTNYQLEHRLRYKDGSYRWIRPRPFGVQDDRRSARRPDRYPQLSIRRIGSAADFRCRSSPLCGSPRRPGSDGGTGSNPNRLILAMPQQQKTNAQALAACQRKVLVVDDEASFTRLLKLNLEATGRYAVKVENDPKSALSAALDFRPDLMLIDVMMPGMDGGDVANHFAAHPELREIPMLFLTATVRHSEVEKRGGNFGGYQFMSKPVNVDRLLKRLETYFSD